MLLLNLSKMKKNLLFPLSVFLLTIVGLLVFSEASNKSEKETSKIENVEYQEQASDLVLMK